MKITMPRYYREFHCIAADCPDSCCHEWTVDVDSQTAAFYRALPGALGDRLREVLKDDDEATVMTIVNGRCPMWRQDGLCRIQAELGHDALCQTCRDFPRLRHDYGDFVELGLELSCPEAARLIFADSGNMVTETIAGNNTADYDEELMATLLRSRREVLEFWDNSVLPLPQALSVVLLYAHSVQGEIDGADAAVLDVDGCLVDAKHYAGNGDTEALLNLFRGLEILTDRWKKRLETKPENSRWDDRYRPLIRYFIRRYWLQAVADYDLVCRVKFIIASTLLLHTLGGELCATAQLFSKEIENDADNVDFLLDGAYAEPALTDANLLGLLLH